MKLTKCYSCFCVSDYYKNNNEVFKISKQRLPRKKKNKIKVFYENFLTFLNKTSLDSLCTCNISNHYNENKIMINNIDFFLKHKDVINHYFKDYEGGIYFSDGHLAWYWEDDNGLYSYDGLMSFCYNEKEAGNTWAYSEVKEIVYYAELEIMHQNLDKQNLSDEKYEMECEEWAKKWEFPSEIKNDIKLIKYLSKCYEKSEHYKGNKSH